MTVQERQQQQQQPPPPVVKRRTLEKTTINHIPLVHVLTSRIDNDTHPQVRIIPFVCEIGIFVFRKLIHSISRR